MTLPLRVLLAAVLTAVAGIEPSGPAFAASITAPPVLVIVRGVPAFEAAREGFLAGMPEAVVVRLDPDMSNARPALEREREMNPSVVVALGSASALAAEQYLPTWPKVVGLILQPRLVAQAGYVRRGFTLTVAPEARIAALDRLFAPLRKLAVLSGPDGDAEADLLDREARARGVEIVRLKVRRADEIHGALKSLDHSVQVLLTTTEPIFLKEEVGRPLVLTSLDAGVPVVGFSEAMVRMGGLAALEIDYRRHGEELAKAAVEVITGLGPATRDFAPVNEFRWVLNLQTARTLGLSIPPGVLKDAGLTGG